MTKDEMARRAWTVLRTLLERQKRAFDVEAERLGLTQVSGYALYMLSELPPGPIGQLATKLNIDPGWATLIVDKLEERGALKRRASATDRRVRVLELTPLGTRLVAQIRDLAIAPRELAALSERELRVLLRIAERAAALGPADGDGSAAGGESAPSSRRGQRRRSSSSSVARSGHETRDAASRR